MYDTKHNRIGYDFYENDKFRKDSSDHLYYLFKNYSSNLMSLNHILYNLV